MKILFLGTSAGWPLPRLGCHCPICRSKDPRDKRLRPAVLVNQRVLIDAGPDIYHQLIHWQVDISQLKALILTHAHFDHILGFYDLTHLYHLGEKEPRLVATQETLNGLRQIFRLPLKPFKPLIVKTDEVFEIEGIKTILFPVKHSRLPCQGVKMKKDRLFVYLPDLKKLPPSQYKKCRDVHLLVLDGSSLGKRGQTPTHQSIEEGVRLAKKLGPKKCYFTHLGHLSGTQEELEEFLTKAAGHRYRVAYDGLELTI